jgi:glycosyltransferase involved in cell wall biosynthesis
MSLEHIARLAARNPAKWGAALESHRAQQDEGGRQPIIHADPDDRVIFRTFLNSFSGFGRFAWKLAEAVEAVGTPIAFDATARDERYAPVDPWLESRVETEIPEIWRLVLGYLGHGMPHTQRPIALFTMHETTRIPRHAVKACNQSRAVIVPTAFNVEGFRASGVYVPIHTCPLGFDPGEGWAPGPRRDDGKFRVLMLGMLEAGGHRKGFAEGVAAWLDAFDGVDDVELWIKVFPGCLRHLPTLPMDSRIRVIAASLPQIEVRDLVRAADLVLMPTYGEGFNLPAIEAMACGVPVVATAATAHAAFLDPSCGFIARHRTEPATGYYAGMGDWHPPEVESLAYQLCHAYQFPERTRQRGAAAAKRAEAFTWEASARRLVDILRRVGMLAGGEAERIREIVGGGCCG